MRIFPPADRFRFRGASIAVADAARHERKARSSLADARRFRRDDAPLDTHRGMPGATRYPVTSTRAFMMREFLAYIGGHEARKPSGRVRPPLI